MKLSWIFFLVAGMVSVDAAMAVELKTDPATAVSKTLGYSVSKQCKVVVTESCRAADARLGQLSTRPVTIKKVTVSSSTKARCIVPATGGIRGAKSNYESLEIVFTPNGSFGYEQITVSCKKSDGSTSQHYVRITVAEP